MMRRRYFLRGLCVAFGTLLCFAIILLLQIGFSYDGKCGGFLPGLAAPRPCSFWEYVSANAILYTLILWDVCWPLVLAVLLLPPFVGHLFDRRGQVRGNKV
jgi:hypothetical protein